MVETLTSQSCGTAATKPRSMSAATSASQHGPWKVKKVASFPQKWEYTPADFKRGDENSDMEFYTTARFVTHIDDHAIQKLTAYYESLFPSKPETTASTIESSSIMNNSVSTSETSTTNKSADGEPSCSFKILDLCGSWISHLPLPLPPGIKVFGMGLNEEELMANPAYNAGWKVFDLNANRKQDWTWFDTDGGNIDAFDVVICTVSIDYLIYPLEVLKECYRILKQAGTIHLAISNRYFATKAISLWLHQSESARLELISNYLHFSGFENIEVVEVAKGGDVGRWEGEWGSSDPVWVVRGRKGRL